jgi:hypothetical protein
MYDFAKDDLLLDLDQLRARLRKTSDAELNQRGQTAHYMRSPRANFGSHRDEFSRFD